MQPLFYILDQGHPLLSPYAMPVVTTFFDRQNKIHRSGIAFLYNTNDDRGWTYNSSGSKDDLHRSLPEFHDVRSRARAQGSLRYNTRHGCVLSEWWGCWQGPLIEWLQYMYSTVRSVVTAKGNPQGIAWAYGSWWRQCCVLYVYCTCTVLELPLFTRHSWYWTRST